jgi:hypothetical protein
MDEAANFENSAKRNENCIAKVYAVGREVDNRCKQAVVATELTSEAISVSNSATYLLVPPICYNCV